VHDVEDFYCAGLIPLHLFAPRSVGEGRVRAQSSALERFKERIGEVQALDDDEPPQPPEFTADALAGAVESIAELGFAPTTPFDGTDDERRQLRQFGSSLITDFLSAFTLTSTSDGRAELRIDEEARRKVEALKILVHVYVIHRPSMAETQFGQRKLIGDLFEHYLGALDRKNVRTLPPAYRERFKRCDTADDSMRLVVDLVSGLTEEEAYRIHHRLTGRSGTSALV
jgi:dGTPase